MFSLRAWRESRRTCVMEVLLLAHRWAMVSTVQCSNTRLMTADILASVTASHDAVASSLHARRPVSGGNRIHAMRLDAQHDDGTLLQQSSRDAKELSLAM